MRKYIIVAAALLLVAGTSHATELGFDNFDYADGSLVTNSGGAWVNHSGTAGDLLVASGQVVVQHGSPSEDANFPFTSQTAGNVFFGIDFTVTASSQIPGSDNEYFAHFKDGGFGFGARLDVVPGTAGGDYTLGISSTSSTAEAIWATDLVFGTTYRAVVRYNIDADQAELWIDASADTDTSILGTADAGNGVEVHAFALRQSDSDVNETILVDGMVVGTLFTDVVNTVPVELMSFNVE